MTPQELFDALDALGPAPTLAEIREVTDRWALQRALVRHSGNVTRAAAELRIGRATIDRQINELGLRDWLTEEYERAARQPEKSTAGR